ncbi:type II toxin-antitoxin system HicB family antitoxin [Nostoc sp. UHCC 0251]|nr:type II toxin-antitoxin system HicB family antitoxin [Nostoc sp. UHCC 0251]
MNLQRVTSLNRLSLHVLVEQASEGHFIASVPELPDCVAEAKTRSDAIA